ncbi:hypothetical protein C2857_004475 [Epichloe festucae Fl1]|uniref:Methyltransferase type 11 domain-containing protein n=1 Tax=Epichloe festucae (strain Fl1) TaxID=877507 RepID=A0A7S9KKN3_EPIFF|nr:hypothetical protein C2857_004475 [Epichloe festucae Fl1]
MASLRTGYGLPARPSDGYRPRKSEDGAPRASIPRPVNRTGSKDIDTSQPERQMSSPSHLLNRNAQILLSRESVLARPFLKISSDTQNKPSSISGRTLSETKRTHFQTGSGSSSSCRSFDNTSKATRALHKRDRPPVPRESGSGSASSASSIYRSPDPFDPGLGIQYGRDMTESPAQIQVVEVVEIRKALAQPAAIYPELDRYRDFQRPDYSLGRQEIDVPYRLATHDLPPPTPGSLWFSGSSQVSAVSGSPSTKFSESPGPGPYSRDTTPTSVSSQSPVLVAPNRVGAPCRTTRQLNTCLTRPPVTRRRAGSFPKELDTEAVDPNGLASVRESLASSSSNSTVKDGDRAARKETSKRSRLPPTPPSPPLRKSSQHFGRARESSEQPEISSPPQGRPKEIFLSPQSPHGTNNLPLSQTSPPTRPSRQNTPDMKSQLFTTSPIIQSNLSSTIRGSEGRGGKLIGSTSLPGSTTSLLQTRKIAATSLPALEREKTIASPKSRPSAERQLRSATEPAIPTQSSQVNTRTSSRTRFPFFGRKKLSSEDPKKRDEKTENKKSGRKGPVAGTGHEGYGRVGAVRRRSESGGSALPRNVTEPQSSYDSLTSSDSFLADRVNPVIISGGEVIENRNTSSELPRSEPTQEVSTRPSMDSKLSSGGSPKTRTTSRSPTGTPALHRSQGNSARWQPDPSASDGGVVMESTLAFRRSVQRLRLAPDSPLRLPQPIKTSGNVSSSSPLTSFDTSILSDESHIELQRDISRESNALHPAPKKLQKKPRSPRKWNLFSRSQNQSNAKKCKTNEQVAATVKAVEKRPVAFYTIMDATEQDDMRESVHADIQEVLRDADVYSRTANIGKTDNNSFELQQKLAFQYRDWAQQQSWQANVDNVSITSIASPVADSSQLATSGRPSRLPQVGRIPKVVKQRQEIPPAQSFSRPFRASNNVAKIYDPQSIATGVTSAQLSTPLTEPSVESSTLDSGVNSTSNTNSGSKLSPEIDPGEKEFLSFSPRKNSNGTVYTSSSSSGAANPYATATAIIPKPEDPPIEDEVWDEYDDFFGDDSMKGPQSATSSTGVPFHLETYQNKLTKEEALDSPVVVTDSRKTSTCSKAPTNSTCYSADMTERIRTAFQPKPSPTTGQLNIPVIAEHGGTEDSGHAAHDFDSKRSSSSSCRTTFSDCSACSSKDGTPLAQVNLRVGSMTVSKWLTFGHVLFSEIRHQIIPVKTSLKSHSILVIDGLGNDDWSFYAAETYPSAFFFNLSPRAPLPAELKSSPTGFPLSPPNHHQVQYTSHLDKFPFAPQSFDAVVYRFPTVAPESHYRNVLSEARRVLRPDGYIELSILDSDLNNMGNRGRRTVRRLKEQIRLQSPDTSFASTADLVIRLLGKMGFANIKAARVGVPVASSIARPGSRREKDKSEKSESGKRKDPPSLAEMMSDNSALADENITKIVTRVGRWWYTRCYERASGRTQDNSIWNDKSFLSECEQFGTSLKLMVCCARAPDRVTSF